MTEPSFLDASIYTRLYDARKIWIIIHLHGNLLVEGQTTVTARSAVLQKKGLVRIL